MTSVTNITTALKKFSGKPLAVTSKMLAAATVASVIYDSHVCGKEESNVKYERDSANKMHNNYKQYISSNSGSATVGMLQKLWFDSKQDYTVDNQLSKVKGYISGFTTKLIPNLPVLGLSGVALLGKKAFSKISGALLGLNIAKILICDVINSPYKKDDINR